MAGGAEAVELPQVDQPGILWSFGQDAQGELYAILGRGAIQRLVVHSDPR